MISSSDIQLLTNELVFKNLNTYSTNLLAIALGLRSNFSNRISPIFCRAIYWKKRKSKNIFNSSFYFTYSCFIFSFKSFLCSICYKKQ